MPLTEVRKRSGDIVDFDRSKIENAIQKACFATETAIDEVLLKSIADNVIAALERDFDGKRTPSIEDIQDHVERALAEHGLFEVAKSYIIYRKERAEVRELKKLELLERIERNEISVRKRDGSLARFDVNEIREAIHLAARDHLDIVDVESMVNETKESVFDGISTAEINKAVGMVLRAHIEEDPAYSRVAARFLWNDVYKEVIGTDESDPHFADRYRNAFPIQIEKMIQLGRLNEELRNFDLEKLSAHMDISRDRDFKYLGAMTLYDRYFVRDRYKNTMELPQHFWMRVAMGLALNEPAEKRTAQTIAFYDVMSKLIYTPSTPTLYHSGMARAQLASCFLNTVPDDLTSIFKSYSDNAQLLKWSGGTGTDWTYVRGTGSYIHATGVESQGVIPFLKIANDVTISINRSGKRRGAAAVYLETWHYDLPDFLELRKNTGDERRRTHDINTVNWIPDLFMKRVKEDGQWTLFCPNEAKGLHDTYGKEFEHLYNEYEEKARRGEIHLFRVVSARDLWKKMLSMLFETGHPWVTFKDPSNVRSPQDHVGAIHNSNLCTEITLPTLENETAVCNLGSLNMAKFVENGKLNTALIAEVIPVAMRMLDNVIDINFYPTEDTKRSNFRHRPVGLGIRGVQDALYLLNIPFDSEEAIRFNDEALEHISYAAIHASTELARERGAYETFTGSKWSKGLLPIDTLDMLEQERGLPIPVERTARLDWNALREKIQRDGMRNSNTMAIAPTATTANIVGCFPSTEPPYKNLYVKSNQAGEFIVVNEYLIEDLKKLGLWTPEMLKRIKYHDGSIAEINEIPADVREKYKEVFEIDPRWLIKAAAYRGKWIDQAQSLNIFYRGTSGKDINDIYFYAWEMGLKTTYYLRTMGASQVEKSTVNTSEYGVTHKRKKTEETPATPTSPLAATPAPSPLPTAGAATAHNPQDTHASATTATATATRPTAPLATPPEKQQSAPATPTSAADVFRVATSPKTPDGPKLCKIIDPDCESCEG